MSIWAFLTLVALAWLTYVPAGASAVAIRRLDGRAPPDAGSSLLPELIIFPPAFVVVAEVLDYFFTPWGRRVVGLGCALMILGHVYTIVAARLRLRAANGRGQ